MRHWNKLGQAKIPGADQDLILFEGKDDFFIKLSGGYELMSTRKHASEDALGSLPCQRVKDHSNARILIGGLGMGFTLAAVLKSVGNNAQVTVAELIPEVVDWNRGPLGMRSGMPLNDRRTNIYIGDVAELLRNSHASFDVIALDVDNGPEGLTKRANDWLYSMPGILAAQAALSSGGVLAYWSAESDPTFRNRLFDCGFDVDEKKVFAHGNKGAKHTIWLATIKV